MRPRILVTPDVTVRQTLGVDRAVYELNASYCDAVEEAGGLPWVAPYLADVEDLVDSVHGVLLTGGDFDVDPRRYGARPHPRLGTLKPGRSAFEVAVFTAARGRGLPVLGVCAGMQIMNVALGGTLWQDLPDERGGPVDHSQKFDRRQPAHEVLLEPGCRLAALYGTRSLRVNSSHHQAVREPGQGVVVTGRCEDGLPEVMEVGDMAFGVGVQWHPETMTPTEQDPRPREVYRGLVEAARARADGRQP